MARAMDTVKILWRESDGRVCQIKRLLQSCEHVRGGRDEDGLLLRQQRSTASQVLICGHQQPLAPPVPQSVLLVSLVMCGRLGLPHRRGARCPEARRLVLRREGKAEHSFCHILVSLMMAKLRVRVSTVGIILMPSHTVCHPLRG